MELPSYIKEAINNEKRVYKEKELNTLNSPFTLNPQTNRYDYDGDLDNNKLKDFISEDKEGFTINFGKIKGYFDCSDLGLKSLKGAPQEVDWHFKCSKNQLTSLEGAPQKVGGHFVCFKNHLTSLEGAPQTVGGWFDVSGNQLTSLEGAPQKVDGCFDCRDNLNLYSLDGIGEVRGKIYKDF